MKRLIALIFLATMPQAANSQIVAAMNGFTSDVYKQVARSGENLVLSPFNVATALSMALAGARGQTEEEIRSVLHFEYGLTYHADLGALLADLSATSNTAGNELLTANRLWLEKGFTLEPAFVKTLADHYQAQPSPLDFLHEPEAARDRINEWTSEHTNEKIRNLFPPNSFDARTRLVLSSAIYFYGKWQEPFLTSRTQPAPFVLSGGQTEKANFMHKTAHFGYTDTPSAQILEMRYAGTGIAFDVLLPKTVTGLPDLEKSVTQENLTGWLGKLSIRSVEVSFPKFRAESQLSLGEALSKLGMPMAFSGKADFSGISRNGSLAINQIVHKAFVDVSEQGTEAAAATGLTMSLAAVHMPEEVVVFRADHPFLFLIRDTRSGVVLFMGRFANPQ